MKARKIHQRRAGIVILGKSKTTCGRILRGEPVDMGKPVGQFAGKRQVIEATIHDTLVTCEKCLHP